MSVLMEAIRLRKPVQWQEPRMNVESETARLRAEVCHLQTEVSRLRAQLAMPLPGCLHLQDRFLPAARKLIEKSARDDAPDGEIEEVEYGGERYLVVLDWPDNDEHLGPMWPVCTGILALTWLSPEDELDSDWVDTMTSKAIESAKERNRP